MSNVYIISDGKLLKIGKADNINSRLCQLQTGNANKLKVIGFIRCNSGTDALQIEKSIHGALKCSKARGEWFRTSVEEIKALGYNIELGEYEPEYINIYLDNLPYIYGLPTTARTLLHELLKYVTDGTQEIVLNNVIKKKIASDTDMTMQTLNNKLQDLLKAGIIDRVAVGTFVLNPYLFGKGDWKTINELRNKNIHLEISYDATTGERKIRGSIDE